MIVNPATGLASSGGDPAVARPPCPPLLCSSAAPEVALLQPSLQQHGHCFAAISQDRTLLRVVVHREEIDG